MRIALAQIDTTAGDVRGNVDRVLAAARRAAEEGADLLVAPELVVAGYPPRDLLLRPGFVTAVEDATAALARDLAPAVGANADAAGRAAELAKADLSSEMVYEFPELQGLMGRFYIEASGGDAAVAAA